MDADRPGDVTLGNNESTSRLSGSKLPSLYLIPHGFWGSGIWAGRRGDLCLLFNVGGSAGETSRLGQRGVSSGGVSTHSTRGWRLQLIGTSAGPPASTPTWGLTARPGSGF